MQPSLLKLINTKLLDKLIFFGLLLAIFPFFILAIYCHPSVDDFWQTSIAIKKGIWMAYVEILQTWSGRYFTMFLTAGNPLVFHSLAGYKLIPVLLFTFFILGANYLLNVLPAHSSVRKRRWLPLLFFALYIGFMPVVSEGFYWMSGAVHYQIANILLLFLISLFIKSALSGETKSLSGTKIILIIAIIGSNETIMAQLFYFLFCLLLLDLLFNKYFNIKLLLYFLIASVCSYVVISSPGNAVRSLEYPNQGNIIFAATQALIIAINNSLNWLINTPILLLTILFIPFCNRLKIFPASWRNIHPIFCWILFYGIIAVGFFVSYYSKADHAPPRVQDTIFLIFILGWFFNIFYTTQYLAVKDILIPALPAYAKFLLGLACFLWLFQSKQSNIRTAYSDLLSGQAARYDKEMNERYAYLKDSPCKSCPIEPVKNIPKTIFFEEVDSDTTGWRNLYTAEYFGKRVLLVNKNQPVTTDTATVK